VRENTWLHDSRTGCAPTQIGVIRGAPEGCCQCEVPAAIAQVSARQQPEFHIDSPLQGETGQRREPRACVCGNTRRDPGFLHATPDFCTPKRPHDQELRVIGIKTRLSGMRVWGAA